MKQNGETLSPEEFETLSKTLALSDVEIGIAAAFADEGFEPIDCRDLAEAWNMLKDTLRYGGEIPAYHLLVDAQKILSRYDLGTVWNSSHIHKLDKQGCVEFAQLLGTLLLARLYGEPDEKKYD